MSNNSINQHANILPHHDYEHDDANCSYHPSTALIKFLASKRVFDSLDEAKEYINRKYPPLEYGQPAVLQYRDGEKIKLLFCIGAKLGDHGQFNDKAEMFQIVPVDEEGVEAIIIKMQEEGKLHIDTSIY